MRSGEVVAVTEEAIFGCGGRDSFGGNRLNWLDEPYAWHGWMGLIGWLRAPIGLMSPPICFNLAQMK